MRVSAIKRPPSTAAVADEMGLGPALYESSTVAARGLSTLRVRTAALIVAVAALVWGALSALVLMTIPTESEFTRSEGWANLVSGTVLGTAVVVRTLAMLMRGASSAEILVTAVHVIAAATNWMHFLLPVPVRLDPVIGTHASPLRYAEWGVTLFLMTVVSEDAAGEPLRVAALTASSQFMCIVFGNFLWLTPHLGLWCLLIACATACYSIIWARWFKCRRALNAHSSADTQPGTHEAYARAERVAFTCCCVWSIFPCLFAFAAVTRQYDVFGILEAVMDCIGKMLYATYLGEQHDLAKRRVAARRLERLTEQMSIAWRHASDVLIVSQREKDWYHTVASHSLLSLVHDADAWIHGRAHQLSEDTDIDRMLAAAWAQDTSQQAEFRYTLNGRDTLDGARVLLCEVKPKLVAKEQYMVIVVRDVTDRERMIEHQIQTRELEVARRKDEEANRFTRHEVKNDVLAAIQVVDELTEQGVGGEKLAMLNDLLAGMLTTITSAALAREIVNGMYAPKRLAVHLPTVISSPNPNVHFEFSPAQPPQIVSDPHLLHIILANAVSNAVKYGSEAGAVRVRVCLDLADEPGGSNTLRMHVHNSAGDDHEELLNIDDPAVVFEKGFRLHGDTPKGGHPSTSSGDGAWIMRLCANALGGTVGIRFDKGETIMTLTIPEIEISAETRRPRPSRPSSPTWVIPDGTVCIGIDDSKMQRSVLKRMFSKLGAPDEAIVTLGTPEEIPPLAATLLSRIRDAGDARVLIICDENLEYGEMPPTARMGSSSLIAYGSHIIAEVRQKLDPDDEARTLMLVRSANDSDGEVADYLTRAHGFLSKAPFKVEASRALFRQHWRERYGSGGGRDPLSVPSTPVLSFNNGRSHAPAAAAGELMLVDTSPLVAVNNNTLVMSRDDRPVHRGAEPAPHALASHHLIGRPVPTRTTESAAMSAHGPHCFRPVPTHARAPAAGAPMCVGAAHDERQRGADGCAATTAYARPPHELPPA